jgi:hypothetical protein
MPSKPSQVTFQWHPAVHERWGEERLHFWFLKYRSIYDRSRYVKQLETLFMKLGIRSYTIYELIGGYDLLVRVWVPHTVRTTALADQLYGLEKVVEADQFKVQDTYRHWPWRERNGGGYGIRKPEPLDIDAGPLRSDLVALNGASNHVSLLEQNGNGGPPSRRRPTRKELSELFRRYEQANLLVRPRYRNRGIKFGVLVSSQRGNPEQLSIITSEISEKVDKACRRGTLNEASLYFGQGLENGRYFILARVPYLRYHEVNDWLLAPINRLMGIVATRTVTYGISTPGWVAHRETIAIPDLKPQAVPDDPVEMLSWEESQTFEVKGSGLFDLDGWIKRDECVDEEKIIKVLARAVVALLNSGGGIVLLGALEEEKYPEASDKHKRLGNYESLRIGNYLCIGIDREMKKRGGWDPYVRHLRQKLLKHIRGSSEFWVEPFQKRVVTCPDGRRRTLLAIPIVQPDEWFYLDDDAFIVRRGPATSRLRGKEMTDYMRVLGPRGGWRN